MKNHYFERLRHAAREYHRNHQWGLENGLFIPHAYPEERRADLSWWDDVGFILKRRRVIVHWVHPRCAYGNAIENIALSEVSPPPESDPWCKQGEKRYRKQGRSRKKVIGIAHGAITQPWADYFAAVRARENELSGSGIDLDIQPSMRVTWYWWATAMDLIAPIEVRSHDDVAMLAAIARRLLKRETTVADEWPGYSYGKVNWLAEAARRR
jgi:hypothetical protein